MNRLTKEFNESKSEKLQVWCCDRCDAVHFKAGNVLLNFSRAEFAELTYAVNDIYQKEFGSLEFYHLVTSLKQEDEILTSQAVS